MDWAMIFDWDGVVVDSRAAHELAWERLAEDENLSLPKNHMERGFGRKNADIIPDILHWAHVDTEITRLSNQKESLYRGFLEKGHGKLLPGALELLKRLASIRIPAIVGSSAPRANIELCLQLFQLEGLFQAIASAEDCKAGKPNPDIFLAAGSKAGVPLDRCVVIEDAPHGIEAAHRAGMKAIAVLTTHSRETMSEADLIIPDLRSLAISSVMDLIQAS